MDSTLEPGGNILDWDESDVQTWLSSIGIPQYEAQLYEHHITGDVLAVLDSESLKEVGVLTVGQRLAILRAVYHLKVAHNVPIEQDHYVPPSEVEEAEEPLTLTRLNDLLKSQEDRIRLLEDDNRRLSETVMQFIDEESRSSGSRTNDDRPLRKQPSFRWAQFKQPARSPTKPETSIHTESPHPSPSSQVYDIARTPTVPPTSYQPPYSDRQGSHRTQNSTTAPASSPDSSLVLANSTNKQLPPPRSDSSNISTSSDNLKSFKVSLDDPAWKVLPAALKKYKINNDDWQNYAMFICYGSIERCLSYDDKPLLLFQKLKDAKKNPVFMLKHIKDIRSPIAVAQQKHAARKAAEGSSSNKPSPGHQHSRSVSRPSKLSAGTPPLNTASHGPAWPASDILSPSVEQKDKLDELGADASKSRALAISGGNAEDASEGSLPTRTEIPSEISYAVAIYPYMAEQDDEFDVVVGDTFIILSRAKGWWVVERDVTGKGIVDPDVAKHGWVPAGCLLETNVPVAAAIEAANAQRQYVNGSPPESPVSKTPILPLSILSTSFPGVALMDYRKKGEEELDLMKDDLLRVFKRYNHWSYAVKEQGGDRGWVPSWFIGKVASAGQVPSTPSATVATANSMTQVALDSDPRYAFTDGGSSSFGSVQGAQVSPMSSAFPPPSQASSRTMV